ncbi:hypothetical protein SPSYN_02099 [Sporotomaculum syntrophicum]|uniref:DUF6602 domain-containing protein n=1 Tax=Sporotomaculum syntrophicum TaxID=182264 RepID=A0A9D2WN95_9FIRM|nr:DUF6602 domain-containing protein [Sporotomaculum syntrophicum]KAF1084323.1 hypothetical protein SPSYN_02099 [Sporotomaculum syntrophicum]
MQDKHDIHDFLISAQRDIQNEYERILKRAKEDPGTAGDQGEENWATLLRNWLPGYFHIVTKGRILCENGYASPQIDVLVLYPSYPKVLLDKKLYLAGGVAAAFECKTTHKSVHVKEAVETASNIRKNLNKCEGSPYVELNSSIIYGLLAHSHSWKGEKSKPVENIENALWEADQLYVDHPVQQLDFITVSDLATWQAVKVVFMTPKKPYYNDAFEEIYGKNGSGTSSYVVASIGTKQQKDYFSPISVLLAGLFSKLSWKFTDMRELDLYFRKVNMMGFGEGKTRLWPISIYSEGIRNRIYKGQLSNGVAYDEWHCVF